MASGIMSTLVHPILGVLGTLLGVAFLIGMAFLLVEKAGFNEL